MNAAMSCEISRKKINHELWKDMSCVGQMCSSCQFSERRWHTHVQQNNDSPRINFHLQFFPLSWAHPFFLSFSETEGHKKIHGPSWQTWKTDLQKNIKSFRGSTKVPTQVSISQSNFFWCGIFFIEKLLPSCFCFSCSSSWLILRVIRIRMKQLKA